MLRRKKVGTGCVQKYEFRVAGCKAKDAITHQDQAFTDLCTLVGNNQKSEQSPLRRLGTALFEGSQLAIGCETHILAAYGRKSSIHDPKEAIALFIYSSLRH